MGGTTSTVAVHSLSEQISEIASTSVQDCVVSARQDQSLVVDNSGFKLWGNYKMVQQSDVDAKCFSDARRQTELQNKIIQAISQASTSDGVALLGAFGSTTAAATTNLTSRVRSTVTNTSIQQSYNSIRQSQSATFKNSGTILFEQAELTQGAKLYAASVLSVLDNSGVFNTIDSHVKQTSAAKTSNPLDFLGDIFAGIGASAAFIILLVILGVLGCLWLVIRGIRG